MSITTFALFLLASSITSTALPFPGPSNPGYPPRDHWLHYDGSEETMQFHHPHWQPPANYYDPTLQMTAQDQHQKSTSPQGVYDYGGMPAQTSSLAQTPPSNEHPPYGAVDFMVPSGYDPSLYDLTAPGPIMSQPFEESATWPYSQEFDNAQNQNFAKQPASTSTRGLSGSHLEHYGSSETRGTFSAITPNPYSASGSYIQPATQYGQILQAKEDVNSQNNIYTTGEFSYGQPMAATGGGRPMSPYIKKDTATRRHTPTSGHSKGNRFSPTTIRLNPSGPSTMGGGPHTTTTSIEPKMPGQRAFWHSMGMPYPDIWTEKTEPDLSPDELRTPEGTELMLDFIWIRIIKPKRWHCSPSLPYIGEPIVVLARVCMGMNWIAAAPMSRSPCRQRIVIGTKDKKMRRGILNPEIQVYCYTWAQVLRIGLNLATITLDV